MKIKAQLRRFNQMSRSMDIAYHNYAKSLGLSDTAFWVLYCISESSAALTQRELCRYWSFSPQTLNSALKSMEKQGIIRLEPVPGNKKNKQLCLTSGGERLVAEAILPLMRVEGECFGALSADECEQMLSLTERYFAALRESMDGMIK